MKKTKHVGFALRDLMIFLLLCNCVLLTEGFSVKKCYIYKDRADCSKQKLTNIPTDIPLSVKSIDLSQNRFTSIQVLNFTNFPNLTTLDLKRNFILNIGKRTFSQLPSLSVLILNTNKIVHLEDYVFDGLPKLTQLLLGFNRIQTVAPNTFRSLSSLKILELSKNQLQTIELFHAALQHMPQLKNLQIRNNRIKTFISKDLTNTSINITYLDLSENPLEKFVVTDAVFPKLSRLNLGRPTAKLHLTWAVQSQTVLENVTILELSEVRLASGDEWKRLFSSFNSLIFLKLNSMKYKLTSLMNMSCSMPTVSKLQLQSNKLTFISSSFFQKCHNVTDIDLEDNKITHIENGSFNILKLLEVLSIKRNRLQTVPFATRNLYSLRKLDLSFNLIRTLECQDFAKLTNLVQLNLQWNSLTALNKCSFNTLSKLEVLKLQGNSMTKLGGAFTKNLPSLKVLLLNNNKLTAIGKHEFRGLFSLLNLSLFENQIETLHESCFHGLKNLTFLQLQKNNLRKEALSNNCLRKLVKLTRLDLSNNHFKYWSSKNLTVPPFMNLSNLETLLFGVQRSKGKGVFPANFLQGLTKLSTFICNNIQLLSFPNDSFTYTPHLTNLDISANDLLDISPKLFSPIPKLEHLRINSINLHSLEFLINSNLTKLNELEARKNAFSVVSKDVIRSLPSLSVLDLKYNKFTCDCDNSWFVQWIKNNSQTEVVDAYNFTCSYPPESMNQKLLHLNTQSCILDVGFFCFISTAFTNILILVVTFTYHFSRFHLIYAYYIFLAWLFDSKNRQKRVEDQYDAFVSYNTHDEAWVYRELVPHLEKEQGWRLCLHHRDFLPGKPIVENIADAIYGSRKTICVISQRYLQSEWCSKEMQLASFRLFDERKDVLILVFLENIPSAHLSPYYRMKKILKKRTYLSWPRRSEQHLLFWEKLRQALGSTNTAEEDRLLLTVTQLT
ncbi:toll-like receptor 13 [Boleophthalmus pectinirostris]|uniref:Toll-like receptor 22d n=1 Tax=Boleophthalmus pectinirostris TaxID=150288 RepID=A0A482ICV9_BOLPE|nr:toll-like receptor 13 [Boleophthalmus pectinirostris]QBP05245.1 toll-like receptor 22d [Boleophthalmus pectinirostris]